MKLISTLITSILLTGATFASEMDTAPVYQNGSQYTAVLDSHKAQWRLLPSDGQDFAIQLDKSCTSTATVPAGLWLLTRDADGKPELLAPSQTNLPAGHSGHVPVVACDEKQGNGVALPASLIQWLSDNTGAVYVQ